NRDEAIVVGTLHIIDPRIRLRDLVEGKIGAGRQLSVVSVDLADLENTGRRAAIAFGFAQAGFTLPGQTRAPGEPVFAEEDRPRRRDRLPVAARPLEQLQL